MYAWMHIKSLSVCLILGRLSLHQDGAPLAAPPRMQPAAAERQPTSLAQLDPDVLYSPEELAEPAAALVAQMSLEEDASLR